jgi:hypothetical protein
MPANGKFIATVSSVFSHSSTVNIHVRDVGGDIKAFPGAISMRVSYEAPSTNV